MGIEYGMDFIAMIIFCGSIGALIIWLILALINNSSSSRSITRSTNTQKNNKWRLSQGEINHKVHNKERDSLN